MKPQDIKFRFICTDKGQHSSRELALFTYGVDDGSMWHSCKTERHLFDGLSEQCTADRWERIRLELQAFTLKQFREGRRHPQTHEQVSPSCEDIYYGPDFQHRKFHMQCPTCRTGDVQISRGKVVQVILAWSAAGSRSFDVSTL